MYLAFTKAKLLLVFIIFVYPFLRISSQDDCSSVLERAEQLFDQGVIEDIPSLLSDCLKRGFTPEENIRAKKLIILAYLFDNKIQDAENTMVSFLESYPKYQIQPGDPAEFTRLFSSFKTYPFLSLGASLGGSLASANLIEPYGPYNLNTDKGQFAITTPEYQIGAGVNFFLRDRLEISFEGNYTTNTFLYSNFQYGFADVSTKERLQRLEFPLSLTYDITDTKLNPYLSLGISYGMIISATSHYKRSTSNTGTVTSSTHEKRYVDIASRRNTSTINAVLGGGIKNKIPGGYLFLDIKYFYGLSQLVNTENRWDMDTAFTFYHTDGDFRLNYLSFSIGYRYSFYKTKKL